MLPSTFIEIFRFADYAAADDARFDATDIREYTNIYAGVALRPCFAAATMLIHYYHFSLDTMPLLSMIDIFFAAAGAADVGRRHAALITPYFAAS